MSLFTIIRKRFRRKALPASGKDTPSRTILRRGFFLPWLHGDYTIQNSELLFSAVSRIANALSELPVQLYQG